MNAQRKFERSRSSFTIYEDSRIGVPALMLGYGPYQLDLLRGERRWDHADTRWEEGYRQSLIDRIGERGLRFERDGAAARISTGYGPPSNLLLALCKERGLVDPFQVVLELREDKTIDWVRVHKVALFGTTHRRFGGGDLKVLKSAYAVPHERGGHLFCGTLARARELIQEMQNEKKRIAALKAEAEATTQRANAEAEAARERESEEQAIRSAFE